MDAIECIVKKFGNLNDYVEIKIIGSYFDKYSVFKCATFEIYTKDKLDDFVCSSGMIAVVDDIYAKILEMEKYGMIYKESLSCIRDKNRIVLGFSQI